MRRIVIEFSVFVAAAILAVVLLPLIIPTLIWDYFHKKEEKPEVVEDDELDETRWEDDGDDLDETRWE